MHAFWSRWNRTVLVAALSCAGLQASGQTPSTPAPYNPPETFTNPLLRTGPDPWVVWWKGFYFFSNTSATNLILRKTPDITDLQHAQSKIVWTPEPGQPWSSEVWAPELHRWGDKWYIYFAADGGSNDTHRIYVVENDSDDPTEGIWTLRGKVADADDRWAIDPTTFELNGEHFLVWSGWKGKKDGEQDLFIAHMSNAWTLDSKRILIAKPKYDWEKHGDLPRRHVHVNEAPEVLVYADRVFIVFSASACWTDFYALGAIEAKVGANLLKAKSWSKIDHPLLSSDAGAQAFGPGHNGFFKSPDGQEDWIIYHANPGPEEGCEDLRSPRIQRFTWNADGTPNFGQPAPLGQPLAKPSQ